MPTDLKKLERRIAALEKVLGNAEALLKAFDGPGIRLRGSALTGLEVDALRASIDEARKLRG